MSTNRFTTAIAEARAGGRTKVGGQFAVAFCQESRPRRKGFPLLQGWLRRMHLTARSSTIRRQGEAVMKLPWKQFTVANLMSAVCVTALGLAGLMNSTPIWASALFTLAVSLVCAAILGAVFCSGPWRPVLVGFSLLGCVYLILAFQFTATFATANGSVAVSTPPLLTVHALALVYDQIDPAIVGAGYYRQAARYFPNVRVRATTPNRSPLAFYQVGQSLAALFAALIGGLASHFLAGRSDRSIRDT
jgi:hypothetical protein